MGGLISGCSVKVLISQNCCVHRCRKGRERFEQKSVATELYDVYLLP